MVKIGKPVKGATLIGDGPAAMSRISMVGNDLELDSGVGVCGKAGQSVPVGVGQPTLRIDDLTGRRDCLMSHKEVSQQASEQKDKLLKLTEQVLEEAKKRGSYSSRSQCQCWRGFVG